MALSLTAATLAEAVGCDVGVATRLLPVATEVLKAYLGADQFASISQAIVDEGAIRLCGWLWSHPSDGTCREPRWRFGSAVQRRYGAESAAVLRRDGVAFAVQGAESGLMSWYWPFSEKRSTGGFSDAIIRAVEAQASQTVADSSSTAAIECVAGLLSRTLAGAKVSGPSWAVDAVNPPWLAVVGRSLIRDGASLSVMRPATDGLHLIPAAFWTWETWQALGEIESEWLVRATTYGPSASTTRTLERDSVVYVRWGVAPGLLYRGRSPASWANLTAKMNSETTRVLGDESSGPISQILPLPVGAEDESVALLKSDIRNSRGKVLFPETAAAGFGEGKAAAPQRDFVQSRQGPNPPESLVKLSEVSFKHMVGAAGASSALFDDSDGTSKMQALRMWHMSTVMPIVGVLQYELRQRLGADIRIEVDNYAKDIVGRAKMLKDLVTGGVDTDKALALSGLMLDDDTA